MRHRHFGAPHVAALQATLASLRFQVEMLRQLGVSPVVLQDAYFAVEMADAGASVLNSHSSPAMFRAEFRRLRLVAKTLEATLRIARSYQLDEAAVMH